MSTISSFLIIFWPPESGYLVPRIHHPSRYYDIRKHRVDKVAWPSHFFFGGGSVTPCASPPPQPSIFSDYSFLGPSPCSPGWQATPCICNGLWLLSRMAVSLKENNWFFVMDQTPRPYPTRSLPAQLWHRCMEWSTVKIGLAEVWTLVSQMTHRCSIHYSTSSCLPDNHS
jgi:hypothetical protein